MADIEDELDSAGKVDKAVRGGIRLASITAEVEKDGVPAPSPGTTFKSPQTTGVIKRLGRAFLGVLLRGIVPMARPVLRRLDHRIRMVVDSSQLAAGVEELRAKADNAHLASEGRMDVVLKRLEDLDWGLSHNREALTNRLDDRWAAIEARMAGLEERLSANLAEIEARTVGLEERLSANLADLAELSQRDTEQVVERILSANKVMDQLTRVVNAQIADNTTTDQTLGLVLEYTSTLLQRRAIPLGDRDFLIRANENWLVVPGEDEAMLILMLESGALEPGLAKVLSILVGPGQTVVDVGANIGTLTVPLAKRVGPGGSIFAIEPVPRNMEVLRRNVQMNGVDGRVRLVQAAASDGSGTADIHVGAILGHSSLYPISRAVGDARVNLIRLDDIIPPHHPVHLVKLDVEGHELHVWRGMKRVAQENPLMMMVVEFAPSHLTRAGVAIDEWLSEVLRPDVAAYEVDDTTGICRPLRNREELSRVMSVNILLLPMSLAVPGLEFSQ